MTGTKKTGGGDPEPAPEKAPRRKLPTIRANVKLEAKQALDGWSEARAYHRKEAGLEVDSGEYKGSGYVVADIVYWFLARSERDREVILTAGRALRLEHESEGGLLPEQEEESALNPALAPGAGVGLGGVSRPLPPQRRRKPKGKNSSAAPRADRGPLGV